MILMVDVTSTQAQAKELAPLVPQAEAQARAAGGKSPKTPPPLTADGLDMMYRQLVEIHAISTAQLAECAHWRQTDSTPHSIRVGASRPRSGVAPSVTRLVPSLSTDFVSMTSLWPRQGWRDEPQAQCQPHLGSPSALPSRCEQSPWQGGQSNFFQSTFEESCGVTLQHTTHYEAATHCPAQASRKATPSTDKEALSDVVTRHAQDGVRGGNKWRK
jgi:hypothetical protein